MDFKQLLLNEKNMGKNPAASYTVEALQEIDRMLFQKRNTPEKLEEIRDDARSLNEQEGALCLIYAKGRIKLELRPHEFNMDLNNCLVSFNNARNWDAAEWLSNLIIEKSSNPNAYRTLGAVAHERGDEDAMWRNYEMYAKTNIADKEKIVDVAKHYMDIGDLKNAGIMYERALLRMDYEADRARIIDCYTALLATGKNETASFLSYNEKVRMYEKNKGIEKGLSLELYRILLNFLMKEKEELAALGESKISEIRSNEESILKTLTAILQIDPYSDGIYDQLLSILREKYAENPRLAECMKKYFNRKNETEAVRNFQKFEADIAYSKGVFVLHKSSRKVGRIMAVKGDQVTINYGSNEAPNQCSLSTAQQTLSPLTNQNIKAIKKGVPAPKIRAKAAGDITWLTRTMIYSLTTPDTGNKTCTIKDMKGELVPSVYSMEEWKKVSDQIKEEVKVNPYVRIIPGTTEAYELLDWPSTPDEKMLHIFRTSATFFEKAKCILESYKRKDIDHAGDALTEMGEYFAKMLEESTRMEEKLASALVLEVVTADGDVNVLIKHTFESLYKALTDEQKIACFKKIDSTEIRKFFIDRIVSFDRNAPQVLQDLMCIYPSYVSQKLKKISKGKYFYENLRDIFANYRGRLEEFFYFTANVSMDDLEKIGMDRNALTKVELQFLNYASTVAMDADFRKNRKAITEDLIKGGHARRLIETATDEDAAEIKPLFFYNEGLDTADRNEFKKMIIARWPEMKEEKPVVEKKRQTIAGFLCTVESYDRKQLELKQLNTVEIPAILKEIAAARELGDLRENSEYQYAKDHKRELERRIGELTNDLNTVTQVKREDVYDDMIGYGTRVVLTDRTTGSDVTYTFLGRWESKPEEGIIDISAPIGKALRDHMVGEDVKFEINGKSYDYIVKSIEVIL